jgi:hypothetical protein
MRSPTVPNAEPGSVIPSAVHGGAERHPRGQLLALDLQGSREVLLDAERADQRGSGPECEIVDPSGGVSSRGPDMVADQLGRR